jgi:hypothetical protein
MLDTFLIPEQTIEKNGEGAPLELGDEAGQNFLLTLRITRVIEQESLEVSVWGSEDGTTFATRLAAFPQEFYTGIRQLPLDLTGQPSVRSIRAKWLVNRWGRGKAGATFTTSLAIQETRGQATA